MPRFCKYKNLHVKIARQVIVKSYVTEGHFCCWQTFCIMHSPWTNFQPQHNYQIMSHRYFIDNCFQLAAQSWVGPVSRGEKGWNSRHVWALVGLFSKLINSFVCSFIVLILFFWLEYKHDGMGTVRLDVITQSHYDEQNNGILCLLYV